MLDATIWIAEMADAEDSSKKISFRKKFDRIRSNRKTLIFRIFHISTQYKLTDTYTHILVNSKDCTYLLVCIAHFGRVPYGGEIASQAEQKNEQHGGTWPKK